jgi:hypothetical protein
MANLYETLPRAGQLLLALQARSPGRLAQTFATFVGQFYDRSAFDKMAREVSELYDVENPDAARTFRSQLDRRLCDRYHAPVAWDVVPTATEVAA